MNMNPLAVGLCVMVQIIGLLVIKYSDEGPLAAMQLFVSFAAVAGLCWLTVHAVKLIKRVYKRTPKGRS